MEATLTPAGQIILRIESRELDAIETALRNALCVLAIASERGDDSLDAKQSPAESADWLETLTEAIGAAKGRDAG
jgi:hypothetical protein